MNAMAHIRKAVFGITQAEMAEIAGASQPTVSRWERGEDEPDREQMARIRAHAWQLVKPWDDRWFFEAPAKYEAQA